MRFLGYCMDVDGRYEEPVKINDLSNVGPFLMENVTKHHELRVCDSEDMIALHVVDQRLLFPIPKEGSTDNKWNPNTMKFETIDYVPGTPA